MTDYREILRLNDQGISQRGIAASLECSRNTVAKVLEQAKLHHLAWPLSKETTNAVLKELLFPHLMLGSMRLLPDFEHIYIELGKSGVTLSLLWNEYCEQCRLSDQIPYKYTQFCKLYREFAKKNKATMRIHHKPGEKMEVDWAGNTAQIINNITGESIKAYVFVAVLPYSSYAYVEAFLSMDMENWIMAHNHTYRYFSGVARILVPDNLKTGVDRITQHHTTINRVYQEMAEHYDTAIIPARVRRPKDKSTVEGTVGIVSTWIIAALRNREFFSLSELNQAIQKKLKEFNEKPFQKKKGSRQSVFLSEEKHTLLPLPMNTYELATWKIATVQLNYHISVEKMHYSVPYEYIKKKVDVRITRHTVEVFFSGNRIASHVRLMGSPGQYSTMPEHMPEKHRQYTQWNGERFVSWAEKMGKSTAIVIRTILASHKIEQQGYKSCMALLKSAEKYSDDSLEAACEKALTYTPCPSYKIVQTILKNKSDKQPKIKSSSPSKADSNHGFVRGADYYGRKS